MITVKQWRRAIGLFGGHSTGRCTEGYSECKHDFWTNPSWCLFVFSLALWTLNIGFNTVNCVIQPHINTLVLANDVETNPGPSVEKQIPSPHDVIHKKFEDLTLEVSKAAATRKLVETSISKFRNSVSKLKGQVAELEHRQQVIHLDIETNSDAIGALQGRVDHIEDALEQQERHSHRENIILHGVPEDKNENHTNVKEKVTDIFNKSVKCKRCCNEDNQRVHRLGRPVNNKPRPIIVRFLQFGDKLSVLKSRADIKIKKPWSVK